MSSFDGRVVLGWLEDNVLQDSWFLARIQNSLSDKITFNMIITKYYVDLFFVNL